MTAKAKKQKMKSMMAYADAEDHARLRKLLADLKPQTYGQLRRAHSLSPIFLETQIDRYPEIFEAGTELATGRPTICLRTGTLQSREDLIMRRMLIKKVRQAGATGVRLTRLWAATRIVSKEVKRLLADVGEVNASAKGRDILYRWSGSEIEKSGKPEESRIQESEPPAEPLPEPVGELDAALELTRKKLIVLCERTHRHLSWLANYLDPVAIRRVLDRWPDQFTVETVNLGNPDLIIRNKRCPLAASPPAVADVLVESEPQAANGPSEPLETILAAETLQELKWKPPSVEMARRRNGRALIRGDRVVR